MLTKTPVVVAPRVPPTEPTPSIAQADGFDVSNDDEMKWFDDGGSFAPDVNAKKPASPHTAAFIISN
jgi:hypothetical protein